LFINHKSRVSPLITDHGEIIHELIGRAANAQSERHSVAYVTIPPGKTSLLHKHPEAEESYFVLKGQARMQVGEDVYDVDPGNGILILTETPHKISNIGEVDLEFLAFCVPAWEPENTVYLANGQG